MNSFNRSFHRQLRVGRRHDKFMRAECNAAQRQSQAEIDKLKRQAIEAGKVKHIPTVEQAKEDKW